MSPTSSTATTLAGEGITVDLPMGWEGAIYRRQAEVGEVPHPVVHVATFPLPADRGDFGNGAVNLMGFDDVLIVILEYEPASAGTALFSRIGLPRRLGGADFRPTTLQRMIPGHAGAQRFFTEAGRPFCLYVVIGAYQRAARLAADASSVLATVRIDPR
jgi:hypothetical protein